MRFEQVLRRRVNRLKIPRAAIFIAAALLSSCSGGGLSAIAPAAAGAPVPTTPTSNNNAPIIGTPTFPIGGSGNCTSGIAFNGLGQTAVSNLTESGYSGTFAAASSDSSVATASITNATLTITAINSGAATITVSDSTNNESTCSVNVTVTGGTVS